jgi:hypothetical protein
MHPSTPSPQPVLFVHPKPSRDPRTAAGLQPSAPPIASVGQRSVDEEMQEPERWDGLS